MSTSESSTIANVKIGNAQLQLLPEKAVYWAATQTLILGDLHLGKATHFIKAGISLPNKELEANNFIRLEALLKTYQPTRVFFLGDLFHSSHNRIWADFTARLAAWPAIRFVLIQGNHDILEAAHYEKAGLELQQEWLEEGLLFTHEPLEEIPDAQYNIAGHIHPGVRLVGKGRQSLRLPCFFFGPTQGILPAFGAFTGLALMQALKRDRVFIVYDDCVQQMR